MLRLFKTMTTRLRTLLILDATLDRQAEFLARHAQRKAGLLRQALEYEEQGFPEVADELRRQTSAFSIDCNIQTFASATESFSKTNASQPASSNGNGRHGEPHASTKPRSTNAKRPRSLAARR